MQGQGPLIMAESFIYTAPLRRYHSTPTWYRRDLVLESKAPIFDPNQYDFGQLQPAPSYENIDSQKFLPNEEHQLPSLPRSKNGEERLEQVFNLHENTLQSGAFAEAIKPDSRSSTLSRSSSDGGFEVPKSSGLHTTPLKRLNDDGANLPQSLKRRSVLGENGGQAGVNPYYSSPWHNESPEDMKTAMRRTSPTTPTNKVYIGGNAATAMRSGLATPMTHSYSEGPSKYSSPYSILSQPHRSQSNDLDTSPYIPYSYSDMAPTNLMTTQFMMKDQQLPQPYFSSPVRPTRLDSMDMTLQQGGNYGLKQPLRLSPTTPTKQSGMQEHSVPLVVSQADKPFACSTCKRRFKRQEHLRRHEKTHTGEKEFKCSVPSCGKAFSRADNMRAHEKTHFKKNGRNSILKFANETELMQSLASKQLLESNLADSIVHHERQNSAGSYSQVPPLQLAPLSTHSSSSGQ